MFVDQNIFSLCINNKFSDLTAFSHVSIKQEILTEINQNNILDDFINNILSF